VIVGIRPENFEDGALVPAENRHNGITFPATVDVVESLGSEKFVYFNKELGTVETAELAELAEDAGRAEGGAETVVARLDPATQITEGQDTELWVDIRAVHVFDPETGRNLTLGASAASAAPAAPPAGGTAPAAAPDGSGGSASDQEDTGSATTPPR
jgi:multiple sugar transport system ATP-binding protein